MKRHLIAVIAIGIAAGLLVMWQLNTPTDTHESHDMHGHEDTHDEHEEEAARGPHGGRLLTQDDFSLEVTIYETGLPPEFRIYVYHHNQPVDPQVRSL